MWCSWALPYEPMRLLTLITRVVRSRAPLGRISKLISFTMRRGQTSSDASMEMSRRDLPESNLFWLCVSLQAWFGGSRLWRYSRGCASVSPPCDKVCGVPYSKQFHGRAHDLARHRQNYWDSAQWSSSSLHVRSGLVLLIVFHPCSNALLVETLMWLLSPKFFVHLRSAVLNGFVKQYLDTGYQSFEEMVDIHCCVRVKETDAERWLNWSDWLRHMVGSFRLVHRVWQPFCRVPGTGYVVEAALIQPF